MSSKMMKRLREIATVPPDYPDMGDGVLDKSFYRRLKKAYGKGGHKGTFNMLKVNYES